MLVFNSTHAACGVALAALLLAACGKSTPAPAPKDATSTAAVTTKRAPQAKPAAATSVARTASAAVASTPAPPAASTVFRVTAVTLGSAQVTQPSTHFTPTEKTIYANVVTTGNTPDAALNARWNYLEGAGMLITSVTQRLASDGLATTTFTLQNPDLWPEGKYNVEISVDGKVVNTQAFTIGK